MTAPERHRFAALDSWRGVAALAVALGHIKGPSPLLANPLHDNLVRGVDFFFVLSGFVIACSYGDRLARGFPVLRFMVLRWGRIWPLHAVMVLSYVALECLLLAFGPFGGPDGRAPFTAERDLAALPVSFLLLQEWVWPGRDLWNTQSWSVSVELALYALAAAAWHGLGRWALAVGTGLALAFGLLDLAALAPLPDHFVRGLVGFGLGMGCWALWPAVDRLGDRLGLPIGAATALEAGLVALAAVLTIGRAALLPIDLVFAAMVLVFAREQGLVSRVLCTAPLRWLGVLSYGLYMVHGMVFGRIYDVLGLIQVRTGQRWVVAELGGMDRILLPAAPAALLAAAMLGTALACSWFAWRFIEWPARTCVRRLVGAGEPTPRPA